MGVLLGFLPSLSQPFLFGKRSNKTHVAYSTEKCFHHLFEEQVERTPDAIAAVFAESHLTYQELNIRANQLAHLLLHTGVGPDVPVGICMQHSLAMIVGLLGILKAGGTYVPLDPNYPIERLTFMLEETLPTLVLTQTDLLPDLPTLPGQTLCLDDAWHNLTCEACTNPNAPVSPENLAYIIYTSGSTGRPKGVMITQQGLANHVQWGSQYFQVSEGSGS